MKWAQLLLAGALLATVVAVPAQAQEERDECECARPWRCRVRILGPHGRDWSEAFWVGRRARLGVWVHSEANPETDSIGALIDRVTPGSPADRAGIEAGDIITKLDGESLLAGGEAYDEDESAPGMRLIERARKLERGDTVQIELRRGDDTRTVELVAGDFEGAFDFDVDDSDISIRLRRALEGMRELPELRFRGREPFALRMSVTLRDLELVPLNPELGEYFGTDEGVLVVSIPEDSELNLKPGDVIQAIGGRKVRSPSHAVRILRSYDPDEEVSFEVLRKKKKRTVKGKVPGQ